jgi:hypothetical protein
VYQYFGHNVGLDQVIAEVPPLPGGGTLAVCLAIHALRQGFHADIYTYNLQLFDPSWFENGVDIAARLVEQRKQKRSRKLSLATDSYLEFLRLGGRLRFEELNGTLLRRFLRRGVPVLTGLSATYLYRCQRERDDSYNDVGGEPAGHFVVLCGYEQKTRAVMVADPLQDNPGFPGRYYNVGMERLIASILLGIVTYDANLLVIDRKKPPR